MLTLGAGGLIYSMTELYEDSNKVIAICQRVWQEPDIEKATDLLVPLIHARLDKRGLNAVEDALGRVMFGYPCRPAKAKASAEHGN